MSYIKTIATAALIAATFAAIPAFASPQDDVQSCRDAITAQSPGMLDGHRLRFKTQKGFKNRVIYLEAIPNRKSAGERFEMSCRLNKTRQVLAVNTQHTIKYAKK